MATSTLFTPVQSIPTVGAYKLTDEFGTRLRPSEFALEGISPAEVA